MSMFPAGWQVEPLSKVCGEIVDCLNKTATVVDGPTPYKMIRTTNVKDGRVNLEETRFVDEAVYRKWTRRFKPKRGDVILTREAPLGEVGLLRSDEHVFLGQRTMAYRANPKKLDQRFLYYSLLGPTLQAQIRMYGAGSTVEHMRVPQAESLEIPFPPLVTQQKIAAILSTYDDLIANNQRRITLLECMAEDIYREWFVRLRFPGHENVKVEKGVPQGWSLRKLTEICDITYGFPFQGDRFNDVGLGRPIIRIRNIPDASTGDYTDEVVDQKYIVRTGDLLIGMDGDFHINHWIGDDAYLVQRSCRLKAKDAAFDAYLAQAIRAPINHFQQTIVGATVGHLGAKHLNSVEILVPPPSFKLQMDALNVLLKQKLQLEAASRKAQATRVSLLPRLISGKLSVDALDIRFPPGMQGLGA